MQLICDCFESSRAGPKVAELVPQLEGGLVGRWHDLRPIWQSGLKGQVREPGLSDY
jgi:hypothetical protein